MKRHRNHCKNQKQFNYFKHYFSPVKNNSYFTLANIFLRFPNTFLSAPSACVNFSILLSCITSSPISPIKKKSYNFLRLKSSKKDAFSYEFAVKSPNFVITTGIQWALRNTTINRGSPVLRKRLILL